MATKDPNFERILARLNRVDTQLADVDEKLRHIIQRLPDDFDSGRDPHAGSDEDSDSFPDSDDD